MTGAKSRLVLACGFKVSFLQGLWLSSVVLGGLALFWMGGLVVARLSREKGIIQRARDHRAVMNAFVAIIGGAGEAVAQLSPYQRRARLIAEALLEAMALIRGPERDQLIGALVALNIDDRLRSRLFTHDAVGRIAAAEALSAFPSPLTVEALQRVWRTARSPALRLAAIRSLVELGEMPSFNGILHELDRLASDPLTFLPLLRLLAQAHLDEALEAFGSRRLSVPARVMMADALASTGDYRVLTVLMYAAADANAEMRAAALRALGTLGHPAADTALTAAMSDMDWQVRAAAGDAAGRIGARSAIPDLVRQLGDPVWWVRFRAAEALAQLGEPGIRSLRLAAGSAGDTGRRAASLALAEKGLM